MAELDDSSDARRTLIGRLALATASALYAAIAVWVLVAGPDEVVAHFGGSGQPTRYDDTVAFVVMLSVTTAAMVALFAAIPMLLARIPIAFVNIPRRELWDTPARRRVLARRVGADMMLVGAVTVLLMVAMLVLSTLGGLGVVLPGWVFWAMTGGYVVLTGFIVLPMLASKRYDPTLLPE